MTDPTYDLIDACYDSPLAETPLSRFLTDHGVRMLGAALPAGVEYGAPRDAFRNAWTLSLTGHMDYWEGYAWDPICGALPFHHAWCVDTRTGLVCDPTWRDAANAVYLGAFVPAEALHANLGASGVFGIFDKGVGFEHATAEDIWGWVDASLPPTVRQRLVAKARQQTLPDSVARQRQSTDLREQVLKFVPEVAS